MKVQYLIAVAALAFAGCGDNESGTPVAVSTSTTTPAIETPAATVDPATIPTTAPDGPYVGSWVAKMTRKEAMQVGDSRLAGSFRLELGRDGRYTAYQELDGPTSGRYQAATDNRLIFGKDKGCSIGGFDGTGIYTWSMNGDGLVLKAVQPETGGCTGRTQTLTYPAEWSRR